MTTGRWLSWSIQTPQFHGAFQKLLEWYNKCIAAGDYFEVDKSFMCVLSIKVPIRKKAGKLLKAPGTFENSMMNSFMSQLWVKYYQYTPSTSNAMKVKERNQTRCSLWFHQVHPVFLPGILPLFRENRHEIMPTWSCLTISLALSLSLCVSLSCHPSLSSIAPNCP